MTKTFKDLVALNEYMKGLSINELKRSKVHKTSTGRISLTYTTKD